MTRWAVKFVLAFCLVGCAQRALDLPKATTPERPPEVAHPEWPPTDYQCTPREVIDVSFREFKTEPTRYFGKCIHIRGLANWKYFYENIEGFYAVQNLPFGISPYMHLIGFYAKNESDISENRLLAPRVNIDAIALAYTCEEAGRRAFAEAEEFNAEQRRLHGEDVEYVRTPMIGGFCHYTDDPVLFISEYQVLPDEPRRLMDEDARRKYGNLVEVEKPTREVSLLTERAFQALRARDIEAVMKLSGAYMRDLNDSNTTLYRIFRQEPSLIDFLSDSDQLPSIRYFFVRDRRPYDNSDNYFAVGCVCKTADCSGQWPIDLADTELDPEWPYVCVRVGREEDRPFVSISR